MNDELLTIRDVANLIGVRYYQIAYAHDAGKLPEPPRFGGRRVYDHEMVEAVKYFFANRDEGRTCHE